jgi:hypothetical protein
MLVPIMPLVEGEYSIIRVASELLLRGVLMTSAIEIHDSKCLTIEIGVKAPCSSMPTSTAQTANPVWHPTRVECSASE